MEDEYGVLAERKQLAIFRLLVARQHVFITTARTPYLLRTKNHCFCIRHTTHVVSPSPAGAVKPASREQEQELEQELILQ